MNSNEETHIHKLMCPKGHNVQLQTLVHGDLSAWCGTCMTSYDEAELLKVPVDRRKLGGSSYHPTVYGHPN
jgi:hypothetical protein